MHGAGHIGEELTLMILEVCIDSVESAIAAQEGGAGRVELCADLDHGGTTPSAGMIKSVRGWASIAVHVMIRPRSGDFCYSDLEFEVMKHDVLKAKELDADGVVFGILTPEGTVDVARTRVLVELARPMAVTFHRAFDECSNLPHALAELVPLGVDRVLTSGGKGSVQDGVESLADLVRRANRSIKVLAGGGVTLENVREIVTRTKVEEVHSLSSVSTMQGSLARAKLFDAPKRVVDASRVSRMVTLLNELASQH